MGIRGTGLNSNDGGIWKAPYTLAAASKPLTILTWVKDDTNDFGPPAAYGGMGNGAGQGYLGIQTTSSSIYAEERDSANAASDAGPLTVSLHPSGWLPVIAVFRSQSSRTLYGTNGSSAPETTALGAATYNWVTLGDYYSSLTAASVPCPATKSMAEFAIWRTELGVQEIASLQSGGSPLRIRPESLLCYFPLRSDLTDLGPLRLRLQGPAPVWGPHPPVAPIKPMAFRLRGASAQTPFVLGPQLVWMD